MTAVTRDGWPGTDRRMIDLNSDNDEPVPRGKKWECCAACQGKGKILVDDVVVISNSNIPRAGSVPLTGGTEDGVRSPVTEVGERRRGNNPFGPRGTLRCLACQRRKKRCEFENVESACVRCQLRHLDCGPKLPPQQRPRSITSVPADYQRPLSLTLDTRFLGNLPDDVDTPVSAGSWSSNLHSLPVSPYMFPVKNNLEVPEASLTALGSPATYQLDAFEPNALGINYTLTTEEQNSMQNAFPTQSSAPLMSHQTSQQTITAQYPTSQISIFESTSNMRFFPTFDDDEGPDNKAHVQQQLQEQLGTSHHSQYLVLNSQTANNNFSPPHPSSAPSAWEVYSAVQEMYPTSNPPSFPPNNRPSSSHSQPPPHCVKCGTVQARQWRKTQLGDLICETCGTNAHLTNLPSPQNKRQANGPGQIYWRNKFSRTEAPSFNSMMSDETNGSSGPHNASQDSEEMLFEMQI